LSDLRTVLSAARSKVIPTASDTERLRKVAEKVHAKVDAAVEGKPGITGVFLGGSYAKDTWLPRDVDIDVFVGFSPQVEEERFERLGLAVGQEAVRGYKPGKKYAQHPYTEAVVDGFKVNIVPYYNVEPGDWRSAADRSVHHVVFVRENFDEEARTQVRLLKRFMKTVGVYGAEIENEGFSGYATEALIHKNKSFEATLRAFAEHRPGDKEYFSLLDPIDSNRDLAKAISRESVARMVLASRAFLERPRIEFFTKLIRVERPRLFKEVYAVAFRHKKLSEDTLWGELKRSARQVAKHVEDEGFKLARFGAASSNETESAIILLPVVQELPELEERLGPGVELAEGSRSFAAKNKAKAKLVWVGEDGRLRLLRAREFTSLPVLLRSLTGPGVRDLGASKEVADGIARSARVLHGTSLKREATKKRWLKEGVSKLLSDDLGT